MESKENQICPNCVYADKTYVLKYLWINLNEAVLKCENSECMYPFKNFVYKRIGTKIESNLKVEIVPSSNTAESSTNLSKAESSWEQLEDCDLFKVQPVVSDVEDIPEEPQDNNSNLKTNATPKISRCLEKAIQLQSPRRVKQEHVKKPKIEKTIHINKIGLAKDNTNIKLKGNVRPLDLVDSIFKFNEK